MLTLKLGLGTAIRSAQSARRTSILGSLERFTPVLEDLRAGSVSVLTAVDAHSFGVARRVLSERVAHRTYPALRSFPRQNFPGAGNKHVENHGTAAIRITAQSSSPR
jgi:hypothetical protein